MPSFPQYQQQFVQDTIKAINNGHAHVQVSQTGDVQSQLDALINALPYYGNPALDSAHRGTLANLLEVNLPNNGITPHPDDYGLGYFSSYDYTGPYAGYRNAFFQGIGQTAAATQVANQVAGVNGNLNGGWWGNYGVTILTDAVRQGASVSLDTSKLSTDLSNNNSTFLQALPASYLGVFQTAYTPTATALNTIISAGQGVSACSILDGAIRSGVFTANINQALAMGGDSTNAATWFLFNLWITLKALGSTSVDGCIQQSQSSGLKVPLEVGPGNWWNGTYRSWYIPLSGSDVLPVASGTINANMPEQETTTYVSDVPMSPVVTNINQANGYCISLCNWGSLNWYNPSNGSCFGKNTGVLMANGSVKPMEQIRLGDEVQSNGGPGKVVLIETPKRAKRPLYQLNKLQVFSTASHPFRVASSQGPMRLAVDPWALIDGIPTMATNGVGTLKEGVVLAGRSLQEPTQLTVDRLDTHPAGEEQEELVYDLLVAGGKKGYATYFVGGPDNFFAVDAETADPWYDTLSTTAILAAIEAILPACRQYLTAPATDLPLLLTHLKLDNLRSSVHKAWPALLVNKQKRMAIPKPDFYMQEGNWDPCASALEFHLVLKFGRMVRRETAMGWRFPASVPSLGHHFVVSVHDIELLGEAAMPANRPVEIQLNLRDWTLTEDIVQTLMLSESDQVSWHILIDQVIDFGAIPTISPAVLIGTIKMKDSKIGQFRVALTPEMLPGFQAEHFVFDTEGQIVGRIAIEPRWIAPSDLLMEAHSSKQWNEDHALAMAISFGQQIGVKLLPLIQK
ncbi:MAG: hint domain-containing protein [Bacteroidota bacterium]